jgi:copper homeostasis protein
MKVLLEIAVDSVADALAAAEAGADRVELCTALDRAGLSATPEMVRAIRAESAVPIAAMVRPREGRFVHGEAAWREHLQDAEALLAAGADGVVFGVLTAGGEIDTGRCVEMVRLARGGGGETVFHRAFDLCADATGALERLAEAGVTRILSAGMSPLTTAAALGMSPSLGAAEPLPMRLERLAALGRIAHGRIELIGCGGVRAGNVAEFVAQAGLGQVHSAARTGTAARFEAGEVVAMRKTLDRVGE